MRWDLFGLVLAIVLWPLASLAAGASPAEVLERTVLKRVDEDLVWSVSTAFGAFLGLALHITFSWGEWRKISGNKPHLWQYIYEDMPGFLTAVIVALISYFGLPVLGSIPAVQGFLGFAPGVNFLSAAAVSYIASSLGYKVRSFFIRKAG